MAQMEGMRRINTAKSPKTPPPRTSPTFEQLLQADTSSSSSPILAKDHDHEEYYNQHHKKSVLTKVKEKAKKLRYSLSKKKHGHEDSESPSGGVTLDDDDEDDEEDEDPEYLGAPMYESEQAPETLKETARQHPRAYPVVAEKHVLPSSVNHEEEEKEKEKPPSPYKTITETVSEKLAPAYAAVSGATHSIASKIAGLTVGTTPTATDTEESAAAGMPKLVPVSDNREQTWEKVVPMKESRMPEQGRVSEIREHMTGGQQTWDKGVPAKESTASGMLKLGRDSEIREHTPGGQQTWDKSVPVKEHAAIRMPKLARSVSDAKERGTGGQQTWDKGVPMKERSDTAVPKLGRVSEGASVKEYTASGMPKMGREHVTGGQQTGYVGALASVECAASGMPKLGRAGGQQICNEGILARECAASAMSKLGRVPGTGEHVTGGQQTWDNKGVLGDPTRRPTLGRSVSDIREHVTGGQQTWDKGVPAKERAATGMPRLGRVFGTKEHEHVTGGQQTWDKGVSVKEYLMHKLEPGEDERALSQVITEAISPKKTPGGMGVVEKVREAVTSLLHNEEPSQSTTRATNLSSSIPISTNLQQATEEENHGRILQAN